MNLLYTILRAGHASGTHHKLALDAVRHVSGAYCEGWQRLLLKHATLYLDGAKAPDNQFKDFKNHVLHVRDNLWGGAPEKAKNWYEHLLTALRDKNWAEAAWCAGVLSHYYTDPIHPFHTGQSDAENNVHRAVEWSISRSYDVLAGLGAKSLPALDVELAQGEDWLRELMITGATRANRQYEALLVHYDFQRGVVDPPAGLDQIAQALIGDLIQYAILSFAQVLQRAFKESSVTPPEVNLTVDTVLATLKLPIKAVVKRIDDKELRRQVEAMYDELKATGRVEQSMPEDERVLKALYDKEVLRRTAAPGLKDGLANTRAKPARERQPLLPRLQDVANSFAAGGAEAGGATSPAVSTARPTPPAPRVTDLQVRRPPAMASIVPSIAARPAPQTAEPDVATPVAPPVANQSDAVATPVPVVAEVEDAAPIVPSLPDEQITPAPIADRAERAPQPPHVPERVSSPLAAAAATAAASAYSGLSGTPLAGQLRSRTTMPEATARDIPSPRTSHTPAADDETRLYLTPGHDVVDAPSIGPKTAERLIAEGVKTVADLFAADPGALAEALDTAHIRAKTIAEWQDQARLVCEIPGLRGTHAQLLVGAGYRDVRRIARAEPREISADMLRFVQTSEGQRILRSGGAPDLEKIMGWVKAAGQVWAAKAA